MGRHAPAWSFTGFLLAGALSACSLMGEPVAAALAGAGTSVALGHNLNGTAYRTFTASSAEVKAAVLDALDRMGLRLQSIQPLRDTEEIVASSAKRIIYVGLEPISAKTTRLKVSVKEEGGMFYDSATATEIVLQTEKVILADDESARGGSRRTRR